MANFFKITDLFMARACFSLYVDWELTFNLKINQAVFG